MTKITKAIAALGIVAGLGVAALPLGSYAASEDVTVSFKVNPTIGSAATICSTASHAGINAGDVATIDCNISYSANSGAEVSIVDKDNDTNLVGTNVANTIAAFASPVTGPLAGGTEGWGYTFAVTAAGAASNGLNGAVTDFTAVKASSAGADVVASSTDPVTAAAGTFTFGVTTAESTVADTYSDVVTIAITAQ